MNQNICIHTYTHRERGGEGLRASIAELSEVAAPEPPAVAEVGGVGVAALEAGFCRG